MAIAAECPGCHRKLSVKNKRCKCGVDLDAEKKGKRVKYHIIYRVNGKQKWEYVGSFDDLNGYSIEDARLALAKRTVQKGENRLMDIKLEAKMTFKELAEWYLGLESVKALASFETIKVYLNKFNREFGDKIVGNIKLTDLENLQEKRKRGGLRPKTVDDEINYAKTMIIKAFNNDMVGGDVLKAFQRVKPKLKKKNANARDRILTAEEYESLIFNPPRHLKDILTLGYWTGMRKGEILNLVWDKVDLQARMIHLEDTDTKEDQAKDVPIGDEAYKVLGKIPQSIHDPHVFLFNGKPIKHFSTALKTACEKAGIIWGRDVKGGFIFHDLRHTFVTDMRKAGVQKSVRMSITGHAPKDMDDRYNRVDDHDKNEGIRKLESYRKSIRQELKEGSSASVRQNVR